jgi:hypothetical protein
LTIRYGIAIVIRMKTELLNALNNTGKVFAALDAHNRNSMGPYQARNFLPVLLALTPPVFIMFAATEVGAWVIRELGRQVRIREKRPESPSLRGTPKPKEIEDDWAAQPRSVLTCLRLGSRLADLDPTLDHTLVRKKDAHGRMVIRARKGGVKGWLEDRRVAVGYSTVMRYKKLAQRLRRVLKLDDRLPLEWVAEGLPEGQSLPLGLEAQFAAARRRLGRILRENPTLVALTRMAEKELGITRLVAVRGAGRKRLKNGKSTDISIISQHRTVAATEERVAATKEAMGRVLRAENLSGEALHLQNRLKAWLGRVAAEGG